MANVSDDLDLDVDSAEESESSSKPKSKKMMIIIMIVVLLLGASTAATLMLTGVLSGDDAVAEEAASDARDGKKKSTKKAKAPLSYISLDPAFVVNFSGDTDVRFLQVSIQLGTRDTETAGKVQEHSPAIRNSLVMLLSSQDPLDLDSRAGKEKLLAEALAEVQKVLKQETGSKGVESAFFTSFVMQ